MENSEKVTELKQNNIVDSEKTKRSIFLLISGILGIAYFIYLISYFKGINTDTSGTQALASGLATVMVVPHMIFVALSVIFTWIGWALKVRWAALVAGILYCVSAACMILYAMFVVVQLILSFVAFAKMKKQ